MKKIQVSHLSFGYDKEKKVIHDASFAIEAGSYTTIIGHNGSGKSTIAKLMIGLLESDSGVITVDDLELSEANIHEIRDRIGIVFQNPDNQFIGASVADDIAFGLENHQVPSEEMQDIIEEFADRVHMRKFLNSEPTKLSGGQKQRVAIAGVLAMKPQIIIFDEATSMLDPQGKAEINALIQDIHAKSNLTIISITHDIEEVAHSDHVIVLDQGNIVLDGTPEEVLFHEQELIDLKLDIPFALKLQHALEEQGLQTKPCTTMEGVVDELCRLHLKN
ncbi:energy-coupling factor transporter ATPase [bacterium c-19]|nr:energy-coupling factor transporter ATPase [bacterium c-19]